MPRPIPKTADHEGRGRGSARSNGRRQLQRRVPKPASRWRGLVIVARAQTLLVGEGADHHPVHTVGAEIDVTDHRRDEPRLRDSEARFRTLADGSPVIIWATKAKGRIEFVNVAFRKFYGLTLEELPRIRWEVARTSRRPRTLCEHLPECSSPRAARSTVRRACAIRAATRAGSRGGLCRRRVSGRAAIFFSASGISPERDRPRSKPRERCTRPVNARTDSSRPWRTSSEIRWRLSARPPRC